MRIFRGEISDIEANVIIGPYPVEKDFEQLKKHGVKTIVSLLDPTLPHEKALLEKEETLANKYQMRFKNFPMISILGQKLGEHYENNAAAAAEEVATSEGKVYLHCYLGIHRVNVVQEILNQRSITVGRYTLKGGERIEEALMLDKAEILYNKGDFAAAQKILDDMPSLTPQAKLLYGWTLYRMGNIPGARNHFNEAANRMPDKSPAHTGLGYCDLRDNNLKAAESHLVQALAGHPEDGEALMGMGLVRYRQGRPAESADFINKVLRLNPGNTEAAAMLARIHAAK
jgi:tetratricopeptide (TPR) repeat protein